MEKQQGNFGERYKRRNCFISYVDLEDGMVHTIVTNEDAGCYAAELRGITRRSMM